MQRRKFIQATAATAALWSVGSLRSEAQATTVAGKGLTKKSLKYGMIQEGKTVLEKFKLIKELGYDGVELDSPNNLNNSEVLAAQDATGLAIPGVVNSMHWRVPLSHPNPVVREQCVLSMQHALKECKLYGGTTVLLVPAMVNGDISYADAYKRSQAEIRKLIPTAEATGIKIAFENVWNNFLLSPLEAAQYVDDFNHPLIGWYFDVGNILRYGWPEHWIQALGKRIMKVDIKEYSRKKMSYEGIWKGFDIQIGDGDCNWAAVNAALKDVGYEAGWGSAEVSGGGRERLQEIVDRMNKVYAL